MNPRSKYGVFIGMALAMQAVAAEYPDHPIRFIVPSAPGGTPDINARLVAAELNKQMGQQIVVDNRAGGGGIIGAEMIARAVPDGYTIGYGSTPVLATNRFVQTRLPYDPDRDLQKVAQLGSQPNVLTVTLSLPAKSVKELIDYAKKNPGTLSFGSAGNGTSMHLSMELFKLLTGTQMMHVPYKAIQQAITEMISGQLQLICDNIGSILPHIKSGRVRALATGGPRRAPALPDVPTGAEAGVPGFEVTVWGGVVVPRGTPKTIVSKLNAEINKALTAPSVKEKFAAIGYELAGGTPEQFDVFVKNEVVKWADVAKRAGVKAE